MSDAESDGAEPAVAIEEKVYRQIRNALLNGTFAPGERLSIRRVAAALETSQMPARTALRRLATEKVLDVLPSGTAVIPRLSRTAFSHLTLMRLELEPLAVRLAAPFLQPVAFRVLQDSIGRHDDARRQGRPEDVLREDRAFLFGLYGLAKSPMLLSFIESMWLRRSPLFWECRWALLGRGGPVAHRHHEMLAALMADDVESACRELRLEIKAAADFILEHMMFETAAGGQNSFDRLSRAKPSRIKASPVEKPVRASKHVVAKRVEGDS